MNLTHPGLHLPEEAFRWFGPGDPVPLTHLRQAGASAVFSALHQIPYGELWPREAIRALCVVPIVYASITSSITVAIALIALATAAHQGWSANLFTTVSGQFPRRAVGSVVGIGGLAGGLGGALLAAKVGAIINTGGYVPLFVIASSAYLLALGVIHFLSPRLETVALEPN